MEELDDLKSIWKQQPGYISKNETEIGMMLKARSNTLIYKLKRNVWIELVFTVICIIVLAYYSYTLTHGALKWTLLSMLVFLIPYSSYYIKKLLLLNQFDHGSKNLKENLEHLVQKLDLFMKFYKLSYSILYPVFFVIGLLFGAMENGFDTFVHKFENPVYTVSFLILSIVFMIGVYTLTNWYLKKLYGNHIEKLKSILAELQE